MSGRVFNADEMARLLKGQVEGPDFTYSFGENFRAVQMAEHSGLVFTIERGGKKHALKDASPSELAEMSAILWPWLDSQFKGSPEELEEKLTPDWMRETPDQAQGVDALVPDALRDKPDDPNLEKDELGLTPDSLRSIIADPALAKRLATGTATTQEKLDDLLTPPALMDKAE